MATLKPFQDACGRLYQDYFDGDTHAMAMIERDDGLIELAVDTGGYFADYHKWPKHQKQAIAHARGKVLDIGCGAGRCLLYLQKKGLDVIGIDNSPLAVKICRKRGAKKIREMGYTQISSAMGEFDTVIMLGGNFGISGNPRAVRVFLRKMYKIMPDDGRIIGETLDPYQTTLPEHVENQRRNRKHGRMGGQIRIRIRYRIFATPWFEWLLLSPKELNQILDGTGWKVGRIFETGSPLYAVILEKEISER